MVKFNLAKTYIFRVFFLEIDDSTFHVPTHSTKDDLTWTGKPYLKQFSFHLSSSLSKGHSILHYILADWTLPTYKEIRKNITKRSFKNQIAWPYIMVMTSEPVCLFFVPESCMNNK